MCMKGAGSLSFLFVNAPIGEPESPMWTSERVVVNHCFTSLFGTKGLLKGHAHAKIIKKISYFILAT